MKRLLQLISWTALLGTVAPSALYLTGNMQLPQVKLVMLVSTIAWFASTPFWMGRPTEMPGADESPVVP
jgi:hypothetical protein